MMIKAAIDGHGYPWPCGVYVDEPSSGFEKIMMAMETTLSEDGVKWLMPGGTQTELGELKNSYQHLAKLRDEVIAMGVLPPLDQWSSVNSNL